ncbi:MAG: molybdenum cofactor guanylyltransferase [Deltaproteobacteria bacterium]|nr:molybdenum cofactor guanylyltransferase [Deltaproteobacteria bacterium]
MTFPCSGVILSGGLSTRFDGAHKAFMRVGGKRIIDRLYEVFSDLFDEIILVTNHPEQFLNLDLTIVTDIFDLRSSLTGIHAGLFYMKNPYAFFSACDTPFLNKALVEILVEQIEQKFDIIMPETAAGFEPLCAIYSKLCTQNFASNQPNSTLGKKNLRSNGHFVQIGLKTYLKTYCARGTPNLNRFLTSTRRRIWRGRRPWLQRAWSIAHRVLVACFWSLVFSV